MAIWDVLKINRKTFINPTAWVDFTSIKQGLSALFGLFKAAFSRTEVPATVESFDDMLKRLNMTMEEADSIGNNYLTFAMIFVLAACVLLGFGIYLLTDKFFLGFLLSLGMTAVMLAQAFRFHFWYFQIKHRKLGCTFEEWRTGNLKDEGSSS